MNAHGGTLLDRFARMPAGGVDPAMRLVLRPGAMADYHALARFHYRAGPPATVARVLAMHDPGEGSPAAVLIISMPTLEGRWRALAWPGRYTTGDKRADARRINTELRTISRLVVDPRWRGMGVGRRLVRAYLDSPLTPATEAVAAMGAVCPVFVAAGMREYRLGPDRRDARLLDALAAAGVTVAALAWGKPGPRHAFLERELRIWADASRTTRRLAPGDPGIIAARAGRALLSPRAAYAAATREGGHDA